MISITCDVVRQLRSVLRKAGLSKVNRPVIQLEARGPDLFARAEFPDITVEYRTEGRAQDTETLTIPMDAVEECDTKRTESITLVGCATGVEASWEDGGVPWRKSYAAPSKLVNIPEVEWSKSAVAPGLVQAIAHASQCAGGSMRYDTHLVQLCGKAGEVIATDGRQALIQRGFEFPWQEDLLVRCASVFTARELPRTVPATVCRGKSHVGIQVGNWTIYLTTETTSRFPDVARVLPQETTGATIMRLYPSDADFLARTLDKLPGNGEDTAPVTVDLNAQVVIRAREECQSRCTEVVLADSIVIGQPVRFQSDRRYLARAIALDFTQFTIQEPDKPILCKDSTRTFIWVPLAAKNTAAPSDDVIRITSRQKSSIPQSLKERMSSTMPTNDDNGRQAGGDNRRNGRTSAGNGANNDTTDAPGQDPTREADNGSGNVGFGALISEAQALKDCLHDGYVRASQLCGALKRHRRQSKLVSSTLASLRQLEQIAG